MVFCAGVLNFSLLLLKDVKEQILANCLWVFKEERHER